MARRVVLAPYSLAWRARFEHARAEIAGAFGSLAPGIEHIGSTSVPGLAAKPIIDILLGAASLTDAKGPFIRGVVAAATRGASAGG